MGLAVANRLRKQGFKVLLTRSSDKTVSIEQRIQSIVRKQPVDLFLSLHANSTGNKNVSGIETFCLHPSLFYQGTKNDKIVSILHKNRNYLYKLGITFADCLQKNIVQFAKKMNPSIVDRGVKYSVTRMLLGVNMPGALLEVGFISNKNEAKLLAKSDYQAFLVKGICKGVCSYFKELKKKYNIFLII